ncbi:hypothetical protein [Pseudomonas sp. EYE_354]|uniref:hypothetical protein n=1 Tax=Pseudomonas sp. EYE_354 TaxID=2853449 RepID=UPI0020043BD3|nr:hypothetical protein [Pseudomonas sp. EYE_354]MCK6189913.1 hypothetical protein [Pseudomonas sp. EYE_354]
MKNWIAPTKINALLEPGVQSFDGMKARQALIAYCDRYQKIYPFEILEAPLEFLTNNVSPESKQSEMRALLRLAAEEYCISLNEIAEALLEVIDTRAVTASQAKKIINHVFEAFSCNESPEEFIPREDAHLCQQLFGITAK